MKNTKIRHFKKKTTKVRLLKEQIPKSDLSKGRSQRDRPLRLG